MTLVDKLLLLNIKLKETLKTGRNALFLFVFFLFATACDKSPPVKQLQGNTLGTRYHITLVDIPDTINADKLHLEIERALEYYDLIFSTYKPASEISRFNRQLPGTEFEASEHLYHVVSAAQSLSVISDGAYDITTSPLIEAWGFGKAKYPEKVPGKEEVQTLIEKTGYKKLHTLENGHLLKSANIEIDLSSIAKGYIVDQISEYLMKVNISSHLVEIGGEIAVSGSNPKGKPWRLGIEKPDEGMRDVVSAVKLSNGGLATSGDYRNFYIMDGKKYSHTINPKTGYPVEHQLGSVTVIMENTMLADAWATTLNVLGPNQGLLLAEEQGIAAFFVEYAQDNSIKTHYTKAMKRYLDD